MILKIQINSIESIEFKVSSCNVDMAVKVAGVTVITKTVSADVAQAIGDAAQRCAALAKAAGGSS